MRRLCRAIEAEATKPPEPFCWAVRGTILKNENWMLFFDGEHHIAKGFLDARYNGEPAYEGFALYTNQKPCPKCESHAEEITQMNFQLAAWKNKKFARFNNEECWLWQGDGEDKLGSLVCPVVISPRALSELTGKCAELEKENHDWRNGGYTSLWKLRTEDRDAMIESQRCVLGALRDRIVKAEAKLARAETVIAEAEKALGVCHRNTQLSIIFDACDETLGTIKQWKESK